MMWRAGVLIFTAAVIAACSGGASAPTSKAPKSATVTPSPTATTLTLKPLLEIRQAKYYANWKPAANGCKGVGGYSDLRRGVAVTLYSPSGDIAGTGFVTRTAALKNICLMVATVRNAEPEKFYGVQFADRDKIAFSRQEIEAGTAASIFR